MKYSLRKKAGFTCEAKIRKVLFKNANFMDVIIYAKIKDE